MRELDCDESWALKNCCFWTVVLEKTLESPLDCKEIKSVNTKGNQSWIFIGRMDTEVETPILWPPDVNNSLVKTLMVGKIDGKRREDDREWEGRMASLTCWTWVWASSWSLLNSCPFSQWCHTTTSSSAVPFSHRLQSFPAWRSFQMS